MPDSLGVKQSRRNAARAARANSRAEGHALVGRRVLFVDDDADIRAIFKRSFSYTGAQIELAKTPAVAIEMAAQTEFHIIVTDLQMPGMTGLEMLDSIWHPTMCTSFILVTGIMQLDLPTNSLSARAISSVVRKPWLPQHIDVALVQAIELYDRRAKAPANTSQVIRLLLIEDAASEEPLPAQLLQTTPSVQFECQRVSRLDEGMSILREGRHDVILSDLSLPDARGLDTVAGLKRVAPGLPIVMLSGSHDETLAMQAVKAGAQDYLAKDEITAQSLQRTIRYALERKNTEEHLSYLAHHDQLTGLANRSLFLRRASAAITHAWANDSKPAIVILDLDHFRTTNELYGHSTGDLLLIEVAERILECLEDRDCLARLGGDEFAIIVEQQSEQEKVPKVVQAILGLFKQEFAIGNHTVLVGVSIGISIFPNNGSNAEELIANADAAMYRAKKTGRNCYQYFDSGMHKKAVEWMELERELRGALDRNEFELHYQPQVDCKSNQVVCFEALLRWNHPSLGHVGPFRFIPVLEANGSIQQVGAWVMRQACKQLAKWRQLHPELRMAVNVSAVQFEDKELATLVTSILRDTGLPAQALELEITEGLLMKDFDHTLATLQKLSQLGVRIAIDDFGTGYSNLSYMARYPIDLLKIDKSITDMIGTRNGDSVNFAVVNLGKALGIEILSEGVETDIQRVFLKNAGVEYYQGYYFSKPMPEASCSERLGYVEMPLRETQNLRIIHSLPATT